MAKRKTFADLALEQAKNVLAELLDINHESASIVWNVNAFKRLQSNKPAKDKSYPFLIMRVQRVARNEAFPFKKTLKHYEHGAVTAEGNTRPAIKLLPVTYGLSFKIVTDDPQQAFYWANRLLLIREEPTLFSKLAFTLSSKKYPTLRIPTQLIITSEDYQIQEVEYDEGVPMEYSIEGELLLNTRNGLNATEVDLIATFDVYTNTDPDAAVVNTDGTTEPLLRTATGKPLPIILRSNM